MRWNVMFTHMHTHKNAHAHFLQAGHGGTRVGYEPLKHSECLGKKSFRTLII